jgi:phage terminase small subunit
LNKQPAIKKSKKLSPKHRKFVASILKGKTEAKAAIDAGYAPKGAHVTGCRLLKNVKISDALQKIDDKAEEKSVVDVTYVLSSLKDIADTCRQKVVIMGISPDGKQIEKIVDSAGANRALELLGKSLKMFVDKIEHSGKVSIADFIQDAYKEKDEAQKQE